MSIGAQVNERLAALTEAGVSVWLDQIRRTLITEGELQRLVDEYSLRGVTSNPAIFEKASGLPTIRRRLRELRQDLDAREIFGGCMKDVQRPVTSCARMGVGDGPRLVSFEVEPRGARQRSTLRCARY